jgi:uncharacterized protein YdhG (YjbR/CyaY superfamily)
MTDRQVRDEVMTLIIAGHETTAVGLTWAWYIVFDANDFDETLPAPWEWDIKGAAHQPSGSYALRSAPSSPSGGANHLISHRGKPAMKDAQKSAKGTTATDKAAPRFSDDERSAMKERAKELKAEARAKNDRAAGESDVLAKIAEMPEPDRVMAERIHAIVKASAPGLSPKTWYGMPAYTNKDGKLVCFFKAADKFKSRYATFGFEEWANLDDGAMWPTSWALTKLTAADEARIGALVKKAAS